MITRAKTRLRRHVFSSHVGNLWGEYCSLCGGCHLLCLNEDICLKRFFGLSHVFELACEVLRVAILVLGLRGVPGDCFRSSGGIRSMLGSVIVVDNVASFFESMLDILKVP